MKKDYKIFNKIQLDLYEYEEVKFSKNENKEIKSFMKTQIQYHKTPYKKVVASIVAVFLSISLIFNHEVLAQVRDILINNIDDLWNNKYTDIKDYIYNINKEAEDKNIKILFKDIILDNGKLIISAKIDYSKFNPSKEFSKKQIKDWNINKLTENDTIISLGGDSTSVDVDNQSFKNWNPIPNLNQENDKKADVLIEQELNFIEKNGQNIKLSNDNFPNNIDSNKRYNFDIKIKKLYLLEKSNGESTNGYGATIDGNWSIKTSIKGEDLRGISTKYNIDKDMRLNISDSDNININLKNVSFSPIYLGLDYSCKNDEDYILMSNKSYLVMFKIYNDKGEEYKNVKINQEYFAKKFSEQNKYINFSNQFLNSYKETKYIKIVPVVINNENGQTYTFTDKSIKIDINK